MGAVLKAIKDLFNQRKNAIILLTLSYPAIILSLDSSFRSNAQYNYLDYSISELHSIKFIDICFIYPKLVPEIYAQKRVC